MSAIHVAVAAALAVNVYLIMKVSEAITKLNGLADQLATVKAGVQALIDGQSDAELGTAGDEAVNRISGAVDELAKLVPVPPPVG